MTVYSGIPTSIYNNHPSPGDIFIVTGSNPLENPIGLNLTGTTEYLVSENGSKPTIGSTGVTYGNVVVHALAATSGAYETTNATLSADKGITSISGALVVGTVSPQGELARANLLVTYGRPDSAISLGNAIVLIRKALSRSRRIEETARTQS